MGIVTKDFDFQKFRSNQEASIRAKNYDRRQLLRLILESLALNQASLLRYKHKADADDYSYAQDELDHIFVSCKFLEDDLADFERLGYPTNEHASYDDYVTTLIESRELQVIMNRAEGNYHVPTDEPEAKPYHPTPPSRGYPTRGLVWSMAAVVALIGFAGRTPPAVLVALGIFIVGLMLPAGEE